MEDFKITGEAPKRFEGSRKQGLVGVVASGNLEVLFERDETGSNYSVEVKTASEGFRDIWNAVIDDFVSRTSPGGLRISINDGGAQPDVVSLRLLQGMKTMETGR